MASRALTIWGRCRTVTGKLQRIVGFYRATDLGISAVVERPTAVLALMSAQVGGEFTLERRVDLVHIVHHQDVLGRDGTIGLQLETPITVRVLQAEQRACGMLDARSSSARADRLVARSLLRSDLAGDRRSVVPSPCRDLKPPDATAVGLLPPETSRSVAGARGNRRAAIWKRNFRRASCFTDSPVNTKVPLTLSREIFT